MGINKNAGRPSIVVGRSKDEKEIARLSEKCGRIYKRAGVLELE